MREKLKINTDVLGFAHFCFIFSCLFLLHLFFTSSVLLHLFSVSNLSWGGTHLCRDMLPRAGWYLMSHQGWVSILLPVGYHNCKSLVGKEVVQSESGQSELLMTSPVCDLIGQSTLTSFLADKGLAQCVYGYARF